MSSVVAGTSSSNSSSSSSGSLSSTGYGRLFEFVFQRADNADGNEIVVVAAIGQQSSNFIQVHNGFARFRYGNNQRRTGLRTIFYRGAVEFIGIINMRYRYLNVGGFFFYIVDLDYNAVFR